MRFDYSPFTRSTVGFDHLFDLLESANDTAQGYPPYNIERSDDTHYRVTVAVAGFAESDLNIEVRDCLLYTSLEENEVPVLGILDQPVLGERFIGVNGHAALHQDGQVTRLKVRECADIKDAILCVTDPSAYFSPEQQAAFARVKAAARMTRYSGDCYLFAALALGFVDIIIEANFNLWDIAALMPLVQGAGGVVTSWDGGDCRDGKTILACGDRRMHDAAMKLLAGS